jgi:hypothetical protein
VYLESRNVYSFIIGVWQGVAMFSLKSYQGLPCSTLLRSVGRPPLKHPYSRFRGDPPAGQVPCGHLLPFWTPHAIHLCYSFINEVFEALKQNRLRPKNCACSAFGLRIITLGKTLARDFNRMKSLISAFSMPCFRPSYRKYRVFHLVPDKQIPFIYKQIGKYQYQIPIH